MKYFCKYIDELNTGLKQKNHLSHYGYLECCFEFLQIYIDEVGILGKKSIPIEPSSRENVIGIFLLDSIELFNEFIKNISISNYLSASCILRNIIENYILLKYLIVKDEKTVSFYFNWLNVKRYYIKKINKNVADKLGKGISDKIDEEYFSVEEKIRDYITKFNCKIDMKDKKKLLYDIMNNNYGWAYPNIKKNPNLSMIAAEIKLDKEYNKFKQLSAAVHNNNLFDKMYNNLNKTFDREIYLVDLYNKFIVKYFDEYLTFYKKDDTEKISFIQGKVDKMEKLISESADITDIIN